MAYFITGDYKLAVATSCERDWHSNTHTGDETYEIQITNIEHN